MLAQFDGELRQRFRPALNTIAGQRPEFCVIPFANGDNHLQREVFNYDLVAADLAPPTNASIVIGVIATFFLVYALAMLLTLIVGIILGLATAFVGGLRILLLVLRRFGDKPPE